MKYPFTYSPAVDYYRLRSSNEIGKDNKWIGGSGSKGTYYWPFYIKGYELFDFVSLSFILCRFPPSFLLPLFAPSFLLL